jgi:hypothetical protein
MFKKGEERQKVKTFFLKTVKIRKNIKNKNFADFNGMRIFSHKKKKESSPK